MTWQAHAKCAGEPIAVFYSDGYRATARTMCAACPVNVECLEHAMTVREPAGVWGGLDEIERERLRRKRRRVA